MLSSLAFLLEKELPKHWDKSEAYLFAFSGGLDSVTGLRLFCELRQKYSFSLRLAYIHHGPSSDAKLCDFRNQSLIFAQKIAQQYGIEFVSNTPSELELSSEAQMREFRYSCLRQLKTEQEKIVLAQHADDLLETRLLQLIRGTGVSGFVSSMTKNDYDLFRPLLSLRRSQLEAYAAQHQLEYLEDPSNQDAKYLRNWLRLEMLPKLEQKRPGSIDNLLLSFERISEALQCGGLKLDEYCVEDRLLRSRMLRLSLQEKSQILVKFLERKKHFSFSSGQISEVIKRLDNNENEYTFRTMRGLWSVESEYIRFQPDNA